MRLAFIIITLRLVWSLFWAIGQYFIFCIFIALTYLARGWDKAAEVYEVCMQVLREK